MITVKTEAKALASGAESIIRDGNVWRCYMPGEIQRPEPPPPTAADAIKQELAASPALDALADAVAKLKGVTKEALAAEMEASRVSNVSRG